MTIKSSERGQALILIVFAIVGLIGMIALSVDGGNAYSDRRNAQNAADTAAFAAARAKVRGEDWKAAALALALSNDYADADPTSVTNSTSVNVEVYGCKEAASSCGVYAGNVDYVQVLIKSTIDTYFGRVIGVWQVTNQVNSVAKAKPGVSSSDTFGNAMVSLMDGCRNSAWNHDPFTISGSSTSIVRGSSVFVNSDCVGAFTQNGSATMGSEDGVCVVGTASIAPGSVLPAPVSNCGEQLSYPPPIVFPKPTCDLDGDGVIDANERGSITNISTSPQVYASTPGYYSGEFPATSPNGKLLMQKGVYCMLGDFKVGAGWEITTDVNGNGTYDYVTEGVLIYLPTGGVTINGSSYLTLHAISDPTAPEDLQNLLFFLPLGNDSTVNINGSSSSEFTGSVWAPSSLVSLEGSSGGTDINGQVMALSIALSGDGNLTVTYNESQNHVITTWPEIELAQ